MTPVLGQFYIYLRLTPEANPYPFLYLPSQYAILVAQAKVCQQSSLLATRYCGLSIALAALRDMIAISPGH